MNGEVVYIDITVNINDAAGIIYMINPVMARSALAGLMCGWSTLPQASSICISYPYIRASRYEAD